MRLIARRDPAGTLTTTVVHDLYPLARVDVFRRPPLPPDPPADVLVTNWGPRDGAILARDQSSVLGVLRPGGLMPCGMAFPVGRLATRKSPWAVFRLVVDGAELEGRFVCVGRAFVPLGDAAEWV
jgi:hypothetical protein